MVCVNHKNFNKGDFDMKTYRKEKNKKPKDYNKRQRFRFKMFGKTNVICLKKKGLYRPYNKSEAISELKKIFAWYEELNKAA